MSAAGIVPLLDHVDIVVSASPNPRHKSLLFSFLDFKIKSILSIMAFMHIFSDKNKKKYAYEKIIIDKYSYTYYI